VTCCTEPNIPNLTNTLARYVRGIGSRVTHLPLHLGERLQYRQHLSVFHHHLLIIRLRNLLTHFTQLRDPPPHYFRHQDSIHLHAKWLAISVAKCRPVLPSASPSTLPNLSLFTNFSSSTVAGHYSVGHRNKRDVHRNLALNVPAASFGLPQRIYLLISNSSRFTVCLP
jgi:hypothetical protein